MVAREIMKGVREYEEAYPVELDLNRGRPIVLAVNEGGHNYTKVDLEDLLKWLKEHRPDLYTLGE